MNSVEHPQPRSTELNESAMNLEQGKFEVVRAQITHDVDVMAIYYQKLEGCRPIATGRSSGGSKSSSGSVNLLPGLSSRGV